MGCSCRTFREEPLARPCVSLTEPSNRRPKNPYMRVPETPPRTRAGFSFCDDARFRFRRSSAAVATKEAPRQLGLDFPEPQRIHFTLSRFDNGAETLSRPMCAEGVL